MWPYGGSGWWALSRLAAEHVVDTADRSPELVRYFRRTRVSDEIFFQTILMNSPLSESIVNDDLRYLEWRNPAVAGGPAVLRREDFASIERSPKLFARKFDVTQDSAILDLIDARTAEG